MSDLSPPPFVVFRAPRSRSATQAPYERALELVGLIHEIVGKATTRFYLKDKLDRAGVGLVFELGRAANNVPSLRWRNYRAAQNHASDAATVLDILIAQASAPENELHRARALVRELIADVAPLTNG